MSYARFTCPNCDAVQDPMLHTVNSSCGGKIVWRGDTLYCSRPPCREEITLFRCDECDYWPDQDECASESGGVCLIATATYGSETAAEVLAFRRLRDEVLLPTSIGWLVVEIYYRISPPFAALIAKVSLLRHATKHFLLGPMLWFIKMINRHRN